MKAFWLAVLVCHWIELGLIESRREPRGTEIAVFVLASAVCFIGMYFSNW